MQILAGRAHSPRHERAETAAFGLSTGEQTYRLRWVLHITPRTSKQSAAPRLDAAIRPARRTGRRRP